MGQNLVLQPPGELLKTLQQTDSTHLVCKIQGESVKTFNLFKFCVLKASRLLQKTRIEKVDRPILQCRSLVLCWTLTKGEKKTYYRMNEWKRKCFETSIISEAQCSSFQLKHFLVYLRVGSVFCKMHCVECRPSILPRQLLTHSQSDPGLYPGHATASNIWGSRERCTPRYRQPSINTDALNNKTSMHFCCYLRDPWIL